MFTLMCCTKCGSSANAAALNEATGSHSQPYWWLVPASYMGGCGSSFKGDSLQALSSSSFYVSKGLAILINPTDLDTMNESKQCTIALLYHIPCTH